MGLGNPAQLAPKQAPFPTGTPEELQKMGENVAEVFSCAIPKHGASGMPIIRGCNQSRKCARFFRNPKIGDFGPSSTEEGTPGQGPENVPISIETPEGDYVETVVPCHAFFAGPYGRMMAARNPEVATGEKIHILGRAGEAQIMISTTLPRTPRSTTDMTLLTTTEVITAPKHKRPFELDPRWKMRRARQVADADLAIEEVAGVSRAQGMKEGVVGTTESTPDIAAPPPAAPAPSPAPAPAAAHAGPVRTERQK